MKTSASYRNLKNKTTNNFANTEPEVLFCFVSSFSSFDNLRLARVIRLQFSFTGAGEGGRGVGREGVQFLPEGRRRGERIGEGEG